MRLLTIILIAVQPAWAQKADTSLTRSYQDAYYHYYMQKYKINRTIGFVCLGTGIMMSISGNKITDAADHKQITDYSAYKKASQARHLGHRLYYIGLSGSLSGALFFSSALINKHKARSYRNY